MNLKEAFRYQNFLDSTLNTLVAFLRSNGNVMKVTQNHIRSKANAEAEDEVLDATPVRAFDMPVDTLISVCHLLLREKEVVSLAIDSAKHAYFKEYGFCLDAEMAANKHRQALSSVLHSLGNKTETKRTISGTAFKFNAEGNQTPYVYAIEETSTPDYDCRKAKELGRKYSDLADTMSNRADICLVESDVKFNPMFNVNDSVADVLERGAASLSEASVA